MVKTHVRGLMGPTVMQYDTSYIKLPKLQAVQARLLSRSPLCRGLCHYNAE